MNWLDIVILVIVAVSTLMGLKNGLIKTLLSFAGLIIGIFLAGRYYLALAEKLSFITQDNIAQVVAFALILIVVMVIAAVLAAVLKWITSLVMLDWVNQLGGAVAGFALGAILSDDLLTLGVQCPSASETFKNSNLAGLFLDRFPAVLGLLPAEFDSIRSFFK